MPNSKSTKSPEKKGRGGYRANAGRRPVPKPVAEPVDKSISAEILRRVGHVEKWVDLIEATAPAKVATYGTARKDGVVTPLSTKESAALLMVHFQSLKFHEEQVYGKAKRAVEHSGEINHNHTFANLSDDDLDSEIGKLQQITEASESTLGPAAGGEEPAAG